jgi:hypothetical protein
VGISCARKTISSDHFSASLSGIQTFEWFSLARNPPFPAKTKRGGGKIFGAKKNQKKPAKFRSVHQVSGSGRKVLEGLCRKVLEVSPRKVLEGLRWKFLEGPRWKVLEGLCRKVLEGRRRKVLEGLCRKVLEGPSHLVRIGHF